MADKSEMQKLQKKILVQRKSAATKLDKKDIHEFSEEYKTFISENKTEREVVHAVKAHAKKAGYTNLEETDKLEKGGKYFREDHNKNIALINYNGLESIHAIASHADSPCLHLKPYPLAEGQKLALLKTHYYGGIKKYQWLNIPLSLRGVAYTSDSKKVEFSLGDKPTDPIFTIPDLLPHLAKDQMVKEAKKLVEGEQLNALIGSNEVDDENISEKAKLAVAKHLYDEYGLVEEDLVSAELMLVPAGHARDIGFDRSMISGYGHDDRSSVFTSLKAILDAKDAQHTRIVAVYDKEEIGSYGKTGAQNLFFSNLIEELIELSDEDVRARQVWRRTKILSADVTSAIDPNFSDVHDSSNANFLGRGVAMEKYGGGGGKYSTSDADAEFIHALRTLFNEHKVAWQTGENGKIDVGGGGTIAMFLARWGADVIDIGIPVLAMHAPYEVAHKADVLSAYNAYKVFLENSL